MKKRGVTTAKKIEPYSGKEFQLRFFLIYLIYLSKGAFWLTPKPP